MTATIAVLGLGEAGGAFARDLAAAGALVRGYDPAVPAVCRWHAVRRTTEMAAAAEMLGELGVPEDVAGAARDHLARL